jgi:hypothetical protein
MSRPSRLHIFEVLYLQCWLPYLYCPACWFVMRAANPLIAFTVGSSLSLTSKVGVEHTTLRHIQARRSHRRYEVGGFHFLLTSRALRFTG